MSTVNKAGAAAPQVAQMDGYTFIDGKAQAKVEVAGRIWHTYTPADKLASLNEKFAAQNAVPFWKKPFIAVYNAGAWVVNKIVSLFKNILGICGLCKDKPAAKAEVAKK